MMRLQFTAVARADLRSILRYIAQDNPRAARSNVAAIKQTCRRLAQWPYLGTKCDETIDGLRYFTHGAYAIYYQITATGVKVIRVAHGARDQATLF